ncbi:hypothetical protein BH20ACI4_BH20ACI4_31430 [soil metagenome]
MLKKSLYILLLVVGIGFLNISAQTVKTISKGVVNGSAVSLPKPVYPSAAKAVRASGAVNVQVTIDEEGSVISAAAVSGHPLLRASAEQAARAAKFKPTLLSGEPVKVTGVIVYNFVLPTKDADDSADQSENPVDSDPQNDAPPSISPIKSPILNSLAINLVEPEYPAAARAVRPSGAVNVRVEIDEDGNVASAEAISGHPLLRAAAVNAALLSKFKPTVSNGHPVKANGVVVFRFFSPAADENPPDNEKIISGGVVNGKALSLPKPAYPIEARNERASGAVNVQVVIDESGNVISAKAVSGHELLREASEQAALGAKFSPTILEGVPVKVSGVIVYNFVP